MPESNVYFYSGNFEFHVVTPYVMGPNQLDMVRKWINRFETNPPVWFLDDTRELDA